MPQKEKKTVPFSRRYKFRLQKIETEKFAFFCFSNRSDFLQQQSLSLIATVLVSAVQSQMIFNSFFLYNRIMSTSASPRRAPLRFLDLIFFHAYYHFRSDECVVIKIPFLTFRYTAAYHIWVNHSHVRMRTDFRLFCCRWFVVFLCM